MIRAGSILGVVLAASPAWAAPPEPFRQAGLEQTDLQCPLPKDNGPLILEARRASDGTLSRITVDLAGGEPRRIKLLALDRAGKVALYRRVAVGPETGADPLLATLVEAAKTQNAGVCDAATAVRTAFMARLTRRP